MALGLLLGSAISVRASADSIDQMQALATGSNSLRTPMAQTFKAGATSQIDRVAIMGTTTSGPVSLTIQLQTVSGGKPSGAVMGSSSFTGLIYCCHAWHDFIFNPAVAVTAGTEYAIVVRPTSGLFTWYDAYSYDAYPNGQLWLASGTTWIYQTYFGHDF